MNIISYDYQWQYILMFGYFLASDENFLHFYITFSNAAIYFLQAPHQSKMEIIHAS